MKKILIVFLLAIIPTAALAKEVTITWSYESDIADSFRLYLDKVKVCEFPGGTVREGKCTVETIPAIATWTLTATKGDEESNHSMPQLNIEAPASVQINY